MRASHAPAASITPELPVQLRTALRLLLRCKEESRCEPADFAVPVSYLRSIGITSRNLSWLQANGYAATDKRRVLVLTAAGADAARLLEGQSLLLKPEVPFYDQELRRLWFHELIVKAFRQPAPDQDCVLNCFQEDNWSHKIYSPLPPHHFDEEPKLRLRRVIRRLNLHQIHHSILFLADGTGEAICWEPREGGAPERRR